MNYHLLKNNLPPVVIKSDDKKNYLRALQEADAGDLDSLRAYIAEKLVSSLELSIKAAKGEKIDELGDWDKKLDLLKKGFKSEDDILKKSKIEAIGIALNQTLISFCDILLNRIEKITILFFDNRIGIPKVKRTTKDKRKYNNLEEIKELLERRSSEKNPFALKEFYIRHYLIGYKRNGLNAFDIKSNFTFILNEYSYSITVDSNPNFKIENPYLQKLSEQDFDLIANEITETLLKKVAETKQFKLP